MDLRALGRSAGRGDARAGGVRHGGRGVLARPGGGRVHRAAGGRHHVRAQRRPRVRVRRAQRGWRAARCRFEAVDAGGRGCGRRERRRSCICARACSRYRRADRPHPRACRTRRPHPRETEVFDLLARGRSIPYVRDALVISRETAATHAKHVYAKLDVHSRQELIDLVH
ncbi:MAG: response regulator transcription factor [Eggerthella lenta]